MAHYANIEDGKVVTVIVCSDEDIKLFPGTWVKTSYNTQHNQHTDASTPLRGNFASAGMEYDQNNDLFLSGAVSGLPEDANIEIDKGNAVRILHIPNIIDMDNLPDPEPEDYNPDRFKDLPELDEKQHVIFDENMMPLKLDMDDLL